MAFFASTYAWRTPQIDFTAIGSGASDGAGVIVERGDRFILEAPGCFSWATGQPTVRTLRTTVDGTPAILRGAVCAIHGDLGLRVDELRVGSAEPEPLYTEVRATFEHLGALCEYRVEDGRQRSMSMPIDLPSLDGGSPMVAFLPGAADTVTVLAPGALALDEFEPHLVALQDLLTFASDLPIGRVSLEATEVNGHVARIYGRERFAPFYRRPRSPVEYLMRLSGDWLQLAIDAWWASREELRPISQVIAGLLYRPGYVEADVILSAAAIEALATRSHVGERPRLSDTDAAPILQVLDGLTGMNSAQRAVLAQMRQEPGRTTLRSKVELLLDSVSREAVANSRLNPERWLPRFIETRNGIAHGSPGSTSTPGIWTDDATLRAIRDANRTVLALALLTRLGAPEPAVVLAAERLGVRYSGPHAASGVFL